jgi:hypothetical protein
MAADEKPPPPQSMPRRFFTADSEDRQRYAEALRSRDLDVGYCEPEPDVAKMRRKAARRRGRRRSF